MSLFRRLYRGETRFDFVGYRKRWYIASAVMMLICLTSMIFRGFNFGIEFSGGNQFLVQASSVATLEEVRSSVEDLGIEVSSAQERGSGDSQSYVIRTAELDDEQRTNAKQAIADTTGISVEEVNISEVSSSWGEAVTEKALLALVVFLAVVAVYLALWFERKMALAALLALLHDLLLTAGVYSLVGFEVTPGTVVGLLTILGYSLYDTVVVFDRVHENAKGILSHNRFSFAESANLSVNQTLMRSINTSLIALLPVGGLLFVGAGILGVGTLKDLALVLFVGMLTGAYSSLFLATPWLVELKMLDSRFKLHAQRVATRRAALERGEDSNRRTIRAGRAARAAARAKDGESGTSLTKPANGTATGTLTEEPEAEESAESTAGRVPARSGARAGAGRPGAKKRSGRRR